MGTIAHPSAIPKCRLCGIFGYHERDIFEENQSAALNEQIFRSVGIQVERDDETTKICDTCVGKIAEILHFCEVCAFTNVSIRKSQQLQKGLDAANVDAICNSNVTQNSEEARNDNLAEVSRIRLIDVDDIHLEMDEANPESTQISSYDVLSSTGGTATVSKRGNGEMDSIDFDTKKRKKMRRECVADKSTGVNGWVGELQVKHGLNQTNHWNVMGRTSGVSNAVYGSAGKHSERGADIDGDSNHGNASSAVGICISLLSEDESGSEIEEMNVNNLAVDTRNHHSATRNKERAKRKEVKGAKSFVVKCRSAGRCNDSFESWDAMEYHRTTYHAEGNKKTYSCHLCKKTFGERKSVTRHSNAVHVGFKRFKCPFTMCSIALTRMDHIKMHMNTIHSNSNVFKCSKCPMLFYRKYLLKNHLGSEHGEGISLCCYLCKKIICRKSKLQWHMYVMHTNRNRFQCSVRSCSKVFSHKVGLNLHTNAVHTNKTVYKCTKCPSKFHDKRYLKPHDAIVHHAVKYNLTPSQF